MRRLLFSFALLSTPLFAAEDTTDPKVSVAASYNNVTRAKFTHSRSLRHHHLTFREGYVVGTYTHELKSKTNLQFGVGYMGTEFHFSHHPKRTSFKEQHFDNLLLQFGASTKEIEDWKWDGGIGMQINTEHFHLSRYTFFNGVLHGMHAWKPDTHLHVGLLGYSGMRYSRVLPIVGFDYKISPKWQLNAVFPLSMSLIYGINKSWAVDAGLRLMLTRQRLGDSGHYKRGLVAYTNWGAEAGLNYTLNSRIRFNVHIGESFAGRMRISTKRDHHRKHLRLNPAPYYGLSLNVAF